MFSSKNLTKHSPARFPWKRAGEFVLGRKYELSLVFCGNVLSQRLNKESRKRDKPTNVLSFPLSGDAGEIFLNLPLAASEAKKFGTSSKKRIGHLYLHGLLHLKGLRHGPKMEREERRLQKRFGVDY